MDFSEKVSMENFPMMVGLAGIILLDFAKMIILIL